TRDIQQDTIEWLVQEFSPHLSFLPTILCHICVDCGDNPDAEPPAVVLKLPQAPLTPINRNNLATVLHQGCQMSRFPARRGAGVQHPLSRLRIQDERDQLPCFVLYIKGASLELWKLCDWSALLQNKADRTDRRGPDLVPCPDQISLQRVTGEAESIGSDRQRRNCDCGATERLGGGKAETMKPPLGQPCRAGIPDGQSRHLIL